MNIGNYQDHTGAIYNLTKDPVSQEVTQTLQDPRHQYPFHFDTYYSTWVIPTYGASAIKTS